MAVSGNNNINNNVASYAMAKKHMHRIHKIHFVGIGGSGMNGIAEVMLNLGYEISGSDMVDSPVIERLKSLGATVFNNHQAANISDADVVVRSTAIKEDNVELVAAHEQRIPVVGRAEMLAEIMRFRFGIAVSGTHGKTTTTSLLASILADAGQDPTFVIGGILNRAGTSAKLGQSQYLIAEADESDASFLHLMPMMSIVLNIDADHMDTYQGDFDKLKATFIQFIQQMPFYGLAVVCLDDPVMASMVDDLGRPVTTYGSSEDCDIYATNIRADGLQMHFDVVCRPNGQANGETVTTPMCLNMPGKHNVLNALACVAVCLELGVSLEQIAHGLQAFTGVGRRFHYRGKISQIDNQAVSVFEDYGHHPREIAAVLEAARSAFPEQNIVGVFQPHRYSRTRDLFEDFSMVLSGFDKLVLSEVYAAGEAVIADADGRALTRAIRARGKVEPIFVEKVSDVATQVRGIVEGDDVVLVMGAGSIGKVAQQLVDGGDNE